MKTLILLLLISIGTQAQNSPDWVHPKTTGDTTIWVTLDYKTNGIRFKAQNKYCEERGHILKDSISMSASKASYILDTEDYTIRVTQKGYEFHCKCERCGEVVVIKPEPKRDTLWSRIQMRNVYDSIRVEYDTVVSQHEYINLNGGLNAYCPKCGSYLVDSYPKNITYLNDKLIRREVRCVSCDYKGYIKR